MARLGCRFHGIEAAGQLLHDCDAVHGDSGSPTFVWHEGGFRIVAIHVSTVSLTGGKVLGRAVGTGAFLDVALTKGGARLTPLRLLPPIRRPSPIAFYRGSDDAGAHTV